MNTKPLPVVFRRRVDDGIVALFPTLPGGQRGKLCKVYGPDGWGPADYDAVIALSFPPTRREYLPTMYQLEQAGYVLEVRKRASAAMHAERVRTASRK